MVKAMTSTRSAPVAPRGSPAVLCVHVLVAEQDGVAKHRVFKLPGRDVVPGQVTDIGFVPLEARLVRPCGGILA